MKRLALIGHDIQHSKSPEIYKELYRDEEEVLYDLLDFKSSDQIPKLEQLLKKYDGVSITSPYKKIFISEVCLNEEAQKTQSINCLYRKNKVIYGANTDYFAIKDILSDFIKKYQTFNVVILGDGVMSKVTEVVLKEKKIVYMVMSRSKGDNLTQINSKNIFANFKDSKKNIIINTCSRSFIFSGVVDENTLFWDFNYNFAPHKERFASIPGQYLDGIDMLYLQAKYAKAFWSDSKKI